jgi:hypothetical protein
MTEFTSDYLSEPDLVFGNFQEEKDPRIGLKNFGPFRHQTETVGLEKIRVGLVGDKTMLEKSKQIVALIGKPIQTKVLNHWLYPDFPGVFKETKFSCSLELSENWQQTILQAEIERITKIVDMNERIGAAAELYLSKISNLVGDDNPPDVIICGIPKQIELYCGISRFTRGAKTPRPTKLERQIYEFKKNNQHFLSEWGIEVASKAERPPKSYDFRNALKGKIMGLKPPKPIQLLRESTGDYILNYDINRTEEKKIRSARQDPASFAWNFSTALFYKANGKPWRLAKLRQDTCYIGISFYRDKLNINKDIETSMAQIFTHDGHGLVLRGTEVYIDEYTKEPHLSEKQAEDLLTDCIRKYTERAGRKPVRVVIHKSTLFSKAETAGFAKAIGEAKRDFVTISTRKGFRFMRRGSYPVLRGTLVNLAENTHLLFSSGYTPRIRTYPGHSVPQPLVITHNGDSEIKEICSEILGLTKLNWNTTAFSTFLPITLAFSNKVGDVLSEAGEKARLQNHYRFYM